ncbi:MAG: hypothetical protein HOD43_06700 [Candidatus Marinimicrobia bacterium]|jgi:hypothetical protein|nr:hypothetical protein [Candidatus Neomarinimicrobiota bacterium]MBT3630069.1 hypothetical protein [Candidatus Neomarinimicrobiota bacterium]MBT3824236.1 hypothetical protein [Candidatus Neomarinimicrobiota bacterium]MBT4131688.1 hypothetical protein [Candidatus Neomarinimicrobiota bacterium]MBT4295482.1 hypothetical protein [Candidatus Neomarinimicrobiota bacterium]
MAWTFKFELDKYEVEDLKIVLEKLKKKDVRKVEVSINGDVRKLATNMLKAVYDQEDFFKDDRW